MRTKHSWLLGWFSSFLFFAQQHMMQPAECCSTLAHTGQPIHFCFASFLAVGSRGLVARAGSGY
jgi:hypothetical protein